MPHARRPPPIVSGLLFLDMMASAAAWAMVRRGGVALRAAPLRSRSTSMSALQQPRLSLVFDINKTILLEDPAGGKDTTALLNEIVSELAWGRVVEGGQSWASAGLPLSIDPPPGLVSYSSFVHTRHPDVAGGDLKAIKGTRDSLKGAFAQPGGPGRAYADEVDALDAALRLPDPRQLDPKLMAAAGLAGRERVVILPAFFHFLRRLQAAYPPGRVALQLRTFGDDLPRIVREYNAFCRGEHPLFPGQGFGAGSGAGAGATADESSSASIDHSLDLEKDAECFGCFFRDEAGPALILGTFEPPTSRAELGRYRQQGHRVMESVQEMHTFIRRKQASARPTLAIRDYWPWWRENLEEGTAGKLVLVDDDDPQAECTIAIDDNIERERAHIIDLRCARTGAPVPFADGVERGHLVRAEPYLALKHPETYFWSVLEGCLAKWSKRREGRGRGGAAPPA